MTQIPKGLLLDFIIPVPMLSKLSKQTLNQQEMGTNTSELRAAVALTKLLTQGQ